MSMHHEVGITCPKCQKAGIFTVWDSINTKLDPDMKDRVKSQEAFCYHCPHCGTDVHVDYGFLYHDMDHHFMVFYAPTDKDQANASSGLGVDIRNVTLSIYECLVNGENANGAIVKTEVEGLDVIPSHIDLVGAEIEMLNLENRERILKQLLTPLKESYDYILIDCSPSLGLITVNALTAADSVIIPVQCEYFALEGISKLLNTIKIIKSKLNPSLEIEGFLMTMYDSRLRLASITSLSLL